jgi:hypothetical protein
MSGVSWEVTENTLNIKPRTKPIKQGMRRFNQEKHAQRTLSLFQASTRSWISLLGVNS